MALSRLAASLYVAVLGCLLAWVGAGSLVAGWQPVIAPSSDVVEGVRQGDVVLVAPAPIEPGQSAIAVIGGDREHSIRRVQSLGAAGMVVVVDGRPLDPAAIVAEEQLVGTARVVVPLVGRPAVWLDNGDYPPLVLWSLIGIAAALVAFVPLARSSRRLPAWSRRQPDPTPSVFSVRRLRTVLALAMAATVVVDPVVVDVRGRMIDHRWPVVAALVVLAAVMAIESRIGEGRNGQRALSLAATTIMAGLASAVGGGLGWLVLALPLMEAAVVFGVIGTALAWTVLAWLNVTVRFIVASEGATVWTPSDIGGWIVELGVLLCAALPIAYLTQTSGHQAEANRRAVNDARRRTERYERIARLAQDLSSAVQSAGSGLPPAPIVDAVRDLGFDSVDLVESRAGVDWEGVAAAGEVRLPPPGAVASGLRRRDHAESFTIVDAAHADSAERDVLASSGLSLIVVGVVTRRIGRVVALRAAIEADRATAPDQVESFRLLLAQVALAIRNDDLASELQTTRDRLKRRAVIDPLTGLANHAGLVQDLSIELLDAAAKPVIVVCSPRDFDRARGRLGHERSDVLLTLVAKRLERVAGAHCSPARLGDHTFALLIPGSPAGSMIADIARRLEAISREPFEVLGELIHLPMTVGGAVANPELEPSEIIRRADLAAREAKLDSPAGRQMQMYQPSLDRDRERRSSLVGDLTEAVNEAEIDGRSLALQYQPVRRLSGRRSIVGFETRVVWTHPIHGPVTPEELLEVAQTSHSRDALERFVVNRALADAVAWSARAPGIPFFVSINALPGGVYSPELAATIASALNATGIDPAHLLVEVSEQTLGEHGESIGEILSTLADLGVGILVDRFGGGMASLSELSALPLSALKLDRQLVANAVRSDSDRMVIESIVGLCERLDLVVMAEGIQTGVELATMGRLGCAIGQGDEIGLPSAARDAAAILESESRRMVDALAPGPTTGPDSWSV